MMDEKVIKPGRIYLGRGELVAWLEGYGLTGWQVRRLIETGVIRKVRLVHLRCYARYDRDQVIEALELEG